MRSEKMNLEQKINEEMKAAMKSGNKLRLETIRSIRAAIIEFAKSGLDRAMNDEDEIKLLNSLAKKRKDAIAMYEQVGRNDAKEQEEFELTVIQEFLPKQLTDEEITDVIKGIIANAGATSSKDFGKVMGPSMKALSGKADGTKVQQIVKSLLGAE
jgi:uncharacterized protein YqeY